MKICDKFAQVGGITKRAAQIADSDKDRKTPAGSSSSGHVLRRRPEHESRFAPLSGVKADIVSIEKGREGRPGWRQ